MKFKVINFRGKKKIDMKVVPGCNLLNGVNGFGKSSALNAIKFAFTGITPTDPIYGGESSASVIWELEDDQGTVIERKLTLNEKGIQQKVLVNGKATTQVACEDFLKMKYGEKFFDVAEIAMYPEKIEEMDSKALIKALLKIMPAKIKAEDIIKSSDKLSPDVLMELEMALPEECTLDYIAELYAEYCDKRKFLKKEISEIEILLKNIPATPLISKQEVEEKLAELAKLESSVLLAEKQMREYKEAVQKNEKINSEIESLKRTLEKPIKPVDNELITKKKIQLDELNKLISSISQTLSVLRNNVSSTKKMLASLEGNKCPLSDKIICNTDKSALKQELNNTLIQTISEGTTLSDREKLYNQKKLKLEEEYEMLKSAKEAYLIQKANSEKIEILKNSIVPVPQKPELNVEPNQPTQKDALIRAKRDYEKIAELEEKKKLLEAKKEALNIVNILVDMLSEKGSIRNSALKIGLKPINDILAMYSNAFNEGYSVRIEIDPEVKILCRTGIEKPEICISSLSTGEKAIFALFVADCLNKIAGFDEILIVDTLERLDVKNYKDLTSMIKVLNYKHAIVASCR